MNNQLKNLLLILLFGTIIGFFEIFITQYKFPYRSVVLSAITLFWLTAGRFALPIKGTSLLMVAVAVLFKINNIGIYNCTSNALLCGPLALLLLGVFYELFATLFSKWQSKKITYFAVVINATAISAFLLFGIVNYYFLAVWNSKQFVEYAFLKSIMAGVAASIVSLVIIPLANKSFIPFRNFYKPVWYALGFAAGIAMWWFGSIA